MAAAEMIESSSLSDSALSRRVATFLLSRRIAGAATLDIQARSGVVTLSGMLASRRDQTLCISCCKRVAGVHNVIDRTQTLGRAADELSEAHVTETAPAK